MFELFSIFCLLTLFLAGLLILKLFLGLGIFAIKLLLFFAFIIMIPIWLPVLLITGLAVIPLLFLFGSFMLIFCGLKLIF